MSEGKNGGSAFPSHGTMGEVNHQGMTLRDYFAAKAMEGILSCPNVMYVDGKPLSLGESHVSKVAYAYADAMLKERSRERE